MWNGMGSDVEQRDQGRHEVGCRGGLISFNNITDHSYDLKLQWKLYLYLVSITILKSEQPGKIREVRIDRVERKKETRRGGVG